jgi:hypothetical protein
MFNYHTINKEWKDFKKVVIIKSAEETLGKGSSLKQIKI